MARRAIAAMACLLWTCGLAQATDPPGAPPSSVEVPVQCGVYVGDASGGLPGERLTLLDGVRARRGFTDQEANAGSPVLTRRNGRTLVVVDAETGGVQSYATDDDGRSWRPEIAELPTLRLQQARVCATPPAPVSDGATHCLRDLAACATTLRPDAPAQRLQDACDAGIQAACLWWLETQRALPDPALAERHDKRELGTFPLQDAALDNVRMQCERQPGRVICEAAARELWRGTRFDEAHQARTRACGAGSIAFGCQVPAGGWPTPRTAGSTTPAPVAATRLPCGRYERQGGAFGTGALVFDDDAMAMSPGDRPVRARLIAGRIHLRSALYGDYVLQPLDDGNLLAMDDVSAFSWFSPAADAVAACQTAPDVVERALPGSAHDTVCPGDPEPGAWQSCCARGSLRACQAIGSRSAIAGDWHMAVDAFTTTCRAHVRAGCDALAGVSERGGSAQGRETLLALCGGNPMHVACDALAIASLSPSDASPEAHLRPQDDAEQAPDSGSVTVDP